jgi:hypothetical protein
MSSIEEAVTSAALVTNTELLRLYSEALWHGDALMPRGTQRPAPSPSSPAAQRLNALAQAAKELPHLFLYAHLVQWTNEPDGAPDDVLEALQGVCAVTLRLTHRALEAHAQTVGFHIRGWAHQGVEWSAERLSQGWDADAPVLIDESRLATGALCAALTALPADRIGVCEQVAAGAAHLLTIYAIATGALWPGEPLS